MNLKRNNHQVTPDCLIEFSRYGIGIVTQSSDERLASTAYQQFTEGSLDFTDTNEVAKWLLDGLKAAGVNAPSTATVCIPRHLGTIRVLEVPVLADVDLGSAIELELESILGDEHELFDFDYVACPTELSSTSQFVVVFTVSRTLIDSIKCAFQAVGIRPAQITLSECMYWKPAPRNAVMADELSNAIVVRHDRVDLVVRYRHQLLQSQSLPLDLVEPPKVDHWIAALRRLTASLPSPLAGLPSHCQLLIDRDDPGLDVDALAVHAFGQQVANQASDQCIEVVDFEFSSVLSTNPAVRTAGFNLASPYRSRPSGFPNRAKVAMIATVFVLLVAGHQLYVRYRTEQLSIELANLRDRSAEVDRQLVRLTPEWTAANHLQRWLQSRVAWNESIREIATEFGKSENLYVVRMQMDDPTNSDQGAITRVEGRARNTADVLDLTRQLAAEYPWLSVMPNGIEPSRVDPQFGSQFRVEIVGTSIERASIEVQSNNPPKVLP
ncbi:hypothetical protein [Neorhodopirellula pilleata]|uniref:Competence protein A n=1 Tax=Neorhodopirellula pilleata TaxID=2714738 RepID=A0A5C6A4C3_9BACT|nr:hypothetical protein [Neorhodopirellula pilleata]TWT94217.1 hypothetical protein Pla100_38270 [Neorhodopirellula pilleata]